MAEEKETGAAAPAAETAEQVWPWVAKLRKPVLAYGDKVSSLSIREPVAGDIEANGDPVFYDYKFDPPQMRFNETNMAKMIASLASVPHSTVKQLHPKDWKNIAFGIASFFTPDGAT